MSLKSRARRLSKELNLPYQSTLQTMRAASGEIDTLVEKGWGRDRAEKYKVDPNLDEEYRAVREPSRYLTESECENCGKPYFEGADKKGMQVAGHPQFCPDCLQEYGVWTCERGSHDILGEPDEMTMCQACFNAMMGSDNS
jgi:hypothetical protein